MELVPDHVYRVVFQIPGGSKRSADLQYVRTSSSQWRFGNEPSDAETVTHCFVALEGDDTEYPDRLRTYDGLAIPAQSILSAEPVE
ncbi:MAG TPA: hypothetical protein VHL52_05390 [Acidimicrobiia bacterium]|nr:hypothetical protein [Acidimicrobiia bacterium]